tara:strand:+ start:2266 stop:3234 length:969 start_codon:yes stop_codon:yes gene_type:complete
MNAGGIYGGIGGALLGAQWAGFDIKFNIEPRPFFNTETFKHNFEKANFTQSFEKHTDLTGKNIQLIIGSPDCKQFSNLGTKRKDKGKLHELDPFDFDYVKFLRAMNIIEPDCFILENVPQILKTLWFEENKLKFKGSEEAIYLLPKYDIQTIILNAKDFGVPQSRKRAFIIGSKKFKPEFSFEALEKMGFVDLIREHYKGKILKDVLNIPEGVANNKPPRHSVKRVEGFSKLKIGESYYGTQNNLRLDPNKHSGTIASHCSRFVHPSESRVLTARENARIMGFPDDFIFYGNESGQLDQIGKSIVPQVSMGIAYYIKEMLNG